jgi:hypothetical protein
MSVAWIIASLPLWCSGIFMAVIMVDGVVFELDRTVKVGIPSRIEAEIIVTTLFVLVVLSTTCLSLAAWMVS